jgi:hypothetical protein
MPRILLPVALGALTLLPGCLTLFSKTEVVRGDEARRPVQFECQQAAETFQTALKRQNGTLGGCHVGVPFVTVYSRNQQLSESALWNDAVAKCDTDQNGIITLSEANIFANLGGF